MRGQKNYNYSCFPLKLDVSFKKGDPKTSIAEIHKGRLQLIGRGQNWSKLECQNCWHGRGGVKILEKSLWMVPILPLTWEMREKSQPIFFPHSYPKFISFNRQNVLDLNGKLLVGLSRDVFAHFELDVRNSAKVSQFWLRVICMNPSVLLYELPSEWNIRRLQKNVKNVFW